MVEPPLLSHAYACAMCVIPAEVLQASSPRSVRRSVVQV